MYIRDARSNRYLLIGLSMSFGKPRVGLVNRLVLSIHPALSVQFFNPVAY